MEEVRGIIWQRCGGCCQAGHKHLGLFWPHGSKWRTKAGDWLSHVRLENDHWTTVQHVILSQAQRVNTTNTRNGSDIIIKHKKTMQRASTSTRWHFTFVLCCHSNETRAPTANPPNSVQLGALPTILPSYIRVCAVVWECGDGQTDTRTRVTNIHFALTHAKCKYCRYYNLNILTYKNFSNRLATQNLETQYQMSVVHQIYSSTMTVCYPKIPTAEF